MSEQRLTVTVEAGELIASRPAQLAMIYETVAGSRLYGISTAESDLDLRAVYVEQDEQLIGVAEGAKVQRSPEGAEVDWEAQPLRTFVRLALANNPNILDTLFAPPRCWRLHTDAWDEIYAVRHAFLNDRARRTFLAMARAHLERVGAPNRRTSKSGRLSLIATHGYDSKDAGHLVRLLLKAEMLIVHGDYDPVLRGEQQIMVQGVRAGNWALPDLLEWADVQLQRLNGMGTALPEAPDLARVERVVMDIYRRRLALAAPAG